MIAFHRLSPNLQSVLRSVFEGSTDDEIAEVILYDTPKETFDRYLTWIGILHYTDTIVEALDSCRAAEIGTLPNLPPAHKYFHWHNEDCNFSTTEFSNGGKVLLINSLETGERMTHANVWIPNLAPDEIAIKSYSENEGLYDLLLHLDIIKPAHRFVKSGFVALHVCRLNLEILEQYS